MSDAVAQDRVVFIWDAPTRLFHWLLLALVVAGWFTGEGENQTALWHRYIGETIAGLLVFRVIWGFVGGERARFADFAAGPGLIAKHAGDLFSKSPKRYLGHNPLGGFAVFLLLLTVAVVVTSGLFSSSDDMSGPFAGAFGLNLSEVHELAFRVLQALVAIHVLGVVAETLLAKDALVPAMITGRKKRRADEPGEDARKAGPIALLFAILFGVATTAALMNLPTPAPQGGDGGHEYGEREGDDD